MNVDLIMALRIVQLVCMAVIVAGTAWYQWRTWRRQRFGTLVLRLGSTAFAVAFAAGTAEAMASGVPGGPRSAYIAGASVLWALGVVAMTIEMEQDRRREKL